MNREPLPRHVERFRKVIAARLGLQFEDSRLGFLAEVLHRGATNEGGDCDAHLDRLEVEATNDDVGALARELTVGETYFFRNADQFRAFAEVCLPARLQARADTRRLRVASAGCASGEEPYSLAMLLHDRLPNPSWDVSIVGLDVNPAALERATLARYSRWALRETPADARERWFRAEGNELVLDRAIRDSVRFVARTLGSDDADVWQPESWDVVFCRNVIMYFTPERQRAVVARIARALAPGGYLFLGHAETLRGLSHDFDLRHTHGTFYYQRRDRLGVAPEVVTDVPALATQSAPLFSVVEEGLGWVDAIARASARIESLTRPTSAGLEPTAPVPADSTANLAAAVELLRRERFTEALEIVRALPAGNAHDPDVLLLQAVLLAHGGRFADADESARRLLAVDALNAGAHYVLALCREGESDLAGATDHDGIAIYLDPSFAMPRLHRGLLARRAGERETARREFAEALALLEREDASRLLFFGGGFGRGALVALCEAELTACGGAR